MEGTIFDIQRFALHDGPGIRTVVFFKGCPLHCAWCCNPESISRSPQMAYLQGKCQHCGECVLACPHGVFDMHHKNLQVNYRACQLTKNCIEECPAGALKIYGRKEQANDIIKIVEKDIPYYQNSGGGLTLSGGDPLYQPDFALDILKKARERNIHTVVETSGYASTEVIKKVAPFTHLFLYDYKVTDDDLHVKFTRKSNRLILQNLRYLSSINQPVHLRCIIVPTVNDTPSHFKAIANLSAGYTNIERVEIMPYHDFGKSKYHEIGQDYTLQMEPLNITKAQKYVETIIKMGGKNIQLG